MLSQLQISCLQLHCQARRFRSKSSSLKHTRSGERAPVVAGSQQDRARGIPAHSCTAHQVLLIQLAAHK